MTSVDRSVSLSHVDLHRIQIETFDRNRNSVQIYHLVPQLA